MVERLYYTGSACARCCFAYNLDNLRGRWAVMGADVGLT